MEAQQKKLRDVSDIQMINESLSEEVTCPKCGGIVGEQKCISCGGAGVVSRRKAKQISEQITKA